MIYTMMQACEKTGMTYQGLKFYCNEGLVPNVKRDRLNRRIFDEHDIEWINSLSCLKNCGMSIQEMKEYTKLCLDGAATIQQRKEILNIKKAQLEENIAALTASVEYINKKQEFYDEVLSGKREYFSNLIPCSCQN
ncbi:MAG: MerR family transcriptional regulator [Synergistaceae bacterium]|nr:MerR family transcriptional regulator [Synergistaceae bacterium]